MILNQNDIHMKNNMEHYMTKACFYFEILIF